MPPSSTMMRLRLATSSPPTPRPRQASTGFLRWPQTHFRRISQGPREEAAAAPGTHPRRHSRDVCVWEVDSRSYRFRWRPSRGRVIPLDQFKIWFGEEKLPDGWTKPRYSLGLLSAHKGIKVTQEMMAKLEKEEDKVHHLGTPSFLFLLLSHLAEHLKHVAIETNLPLRLAFSHTEIRRYLKSASQP